MSLPRPHNGVVLRYSFLWPNGVEHRRQEENEKDRPVVIVQSKRDNEDNIIVSVLPITHSEPKEPDGAMEIPPDIKKTLGLDSERSWVRFDTVNRFTWPSPELRQIPGEEGKFSYGQLPRKFYEEMIVKFHEFGKDRRRIKMVKRAEQVAPSL